MSTDPQLAATFVRTRAEADFRALYRLVGPGAYGLALRLAGHDRDEASDVMQEAWGRAVERLGRYRVGEPFGPWLRGIVVNCWRERSRARRRNHELRLHEDQLVPGAEAADADLPIDRIALGNAVQNLPDGFREVLVLHDIEGYTHAEIGALLGVSEGTSKSQLSRARARLRLLLALAAPASASRPDDSTGEGRNAI